MEAAIPVGILDRMSPKSKDKSGANVRGSIGASELERLRKLIERHATDFGPNYTPLPGLTLYRSDCTTDPRRGEADSLALAFVVQGSKKVRVGDAELEYGPGQVLVLTRSLSFDTWITRGSQMRPYLSMYQAIPPNLVAETLIELSGAEDSAPTATSTRSHFGEVYVTEADPDLLGATVRLVRTLDDPTARSILGPMILREIVFHLLRSDAAAGLRESACNSGDELRIREAMLYMEANANQRLTVPQVAKAVAMSPSHFAHRFRDVARVTPMQYLKHVRLREARLLLLEEGARASEAGERVGYRSPSHFSRDFAQAFGVSPSQYAERFRGDRG